MELKIASWNINSVRLRAQTIVKFLKQWQPDVLTLQETKCPEGQFPSSVFAEAGYPYFAERGQSGHHGVGIISRIPFTDCYSKQFCGKDDARHVSIKLDIPEKVTVHSFYVPAGGDVADVNENEKFKHKMEFLDQLEKWQTEKHIKTTGSSILTGDLNIAPHENDVWSHKQLLKVVSHTPIELEKLEAVRRAGNWLDVLRDFADDDEKLYSWWSYRSKDWQKSNRGRRLDHIWLDESLKGKCISTDIAKQVRGWEKPSDHVPILATLKL